MICDNCLDRMEKWAWHNNQRLCKICLHKTRPQSHRCNDVECKVPTIKDLMEKWNDRT